MVPDITSAEFEDLRQLILDVAGISLSDTKRALVSARLSRRVRHLGCASFGEYYQHLTRQDPQGIERREMINCITTNKTEFFRESHHFDFLREHVLLPLRTRRRQGTAAALRIWSAGCSTGEEPYSIAMTLAEQLGAPERAGARILASDIDTEVLRKAALGVYAADDMGGVSDAMRRRHFLNGVGAQRGKVRVQPALQEMVAFRRINLIDPSWPVRVRFDVIFCRNVMIYFNRETQERLIQRFSRQLAPGGFLILGHSENLHWHTGDLESMSGTVYRLKAA